MKLLQKTGRIYLIYTFLIIVIVGAGLYLVLTNFINEEINEKLIVNTERLAKKIDSGEEVTSVYPVMIIEPTNRKCIEKVNIKDTLIFDSVEGEKELFREVTSLKSIHGACYRIVVRQVIPEPEDILSSIGFMLAVFSILLMFGIFLINRKILSRIWEPFFNTLSALKYFNFRAGQNLELQKSGIQEFDMLNRTLESYTRKLNSDFKSIKAFAENASHEMQTPLSVAQAKLDEAIQDNNLSDNLSVKLKVAMSNMSKLNRLNKSLLLLAKIENQQFTVNEEIVLHEIVDKLVLDIDELITLKNISLTSETDSAMKVRANRELIIILISNLLRNAIQHNYPGGEISIKISGQKFIISNTSENQISEPEKMFNRFHKANQSDSSTGLGLAIVKSICELYGWNPKFHIKNLMNIIEVDFNFKIPSES